MTVDKNYFPGWTRKAVTFTIDDGNVPMDKRFIEIVKPAGIKGTFNLFSSNLGYMSREEYRELYRDYEIGNHVKYHPSAIRDGECFEVVDLPFDRETADKSLVYKNPDVEGLGFIHITKRIPDHERKGPEGWGRVALSTEDYIRFTEESRVELEEFFGEGRVRGFIWPGGIQKNSELIAALRAMGYESMRRAGGARTGPDAFDLPTDRQDWVYNANHRNILDATERFEALSDDGELKFLAVGVHSVDYENENKWEDLRTFAERIGNRPEDYYYASVGEIFDYEDAIAALTVTDTELINPTSLDLYVKIDGNPVKVKANSTYHL